MPVTKQDKEFLLPMVSMVEAKRVDLERMLINLLIQLRFDGSPTVRGKAKPLTVEELSAKACGRDFAGTLRGIAGPEEQEVIRRWLESDLLDLVNRGDPRKESLAAARPMHLSAYRLRNPKFCRDYGSGAAVYNLLIWEAQDVLRTLREFFGEGLDPYTDAYDGRTELDIETNLLLRLADQVPADQPDHRRKATRSYPLCITQTRVFADDLRRVLAYRDRVPRAVLIGYLKNVIGLHLFLYTLRLFAILPTLVEHERYPEACDRCHNDVGAPEPCRACPFRPTIVVDLGDDSRSPMAGIARQSVRNQMAALDRYVKAHLTVKKLHELSTRLVQRGKLSQVPDRVLGILDLRLNTDSITFQAYFEERIASLMEPDGESEPDARLEEIQRLGLPPLETYVEMLFLLRQRFHMQYYTELLDGLVQKNQEAGLMRQGRGQINNQRRFAIGSQLLETMAQIAVLKRVGVRYVTEPLLIDEFIDLLRDRYGIHLASLPEGTEPTPADLAALRGNMAEFKRRLREIGFYTDLSDASITQLIRPRYTVEATV